MPAILRDQVWQFVGAFFGLVAIIVSIILYRTQRRRKALSCVTISRTSLLSIEDEIKGKLEIFFDGKPVQDVHLIVFKIINSGDVPIVSTDYERPVSLTFGENPQILSAEVSETNPDNLGASVDIEATKVVLEPVLLNSGDSITLKLLVSQLDEISVDGRIVGVRDIRELAGVRDTNPFVSLLLLLLYGAFGLMGLGAILTAFTRYKDAGATLLGWGMCLLGIVSFMLIVVSFIRDLVKSRLLGR